jgi:uroporphyrinogen III methyltransferase / synthase
MVSLPLLGKRIAVTRARAQSEGLLQALTSLGATVVEIPTIEVRNPDSWITFDEALRRLPSFDFLILTSVNGVQKLLERLAANRQRVTDLAHLEVGAIGPATAAELRAAGIRVDFVPGSYRAEGLIEALSERDITGKRFLIPRARIARDVVPRALSERGAHVEVVEAYHTVLPTFDREALRAKLHPPPDLVTFTSSSTAVNFARLLEEHGRGGLMLPAEVRAASIGPITSDTARSLGFQVVLEAQEYTVPALIASIRRYFEDATFLPPGLDKAK